MTEEIFRDKQFSVGHSGKFSTIAEFVGAESAKLETVPYLEELIQKNGQGYYRIDHEIEALGGDKTERHGWDIFGKEKFPEYEVFWRNHVVPITDRLKGSIHYKPDAPDDLVVISSIHFSIYSNFDFVYTCWKGDAREYYGEKFNELSHNIFDLSMFKLSNTCDLVEQFLYSWYKREDALNQQYFKLKKIKAIKKIIVKTRAQAMERMGKYPDMHVKLKRRTEVLEAVLKNINPESKKVFKEFKEFAIKVRDYRDVIAHSWESFHIGNKVPKPETLTKYQNWQELSKIIKSGNKEENAKIITDDFIEMQELVYNYADVLILLINQLWQKTVTSES